MKNVIEPTREVLGLMGTKFKKKLNDGCAMDANDFK